MEVTIDFMIKLLISKDSLIKEEYDRSHIIIDRFTEHSYFISFQQK